MTHGCCGQWSQSLACSLAYGSGKPEWLILQTIFLFHTLLINIPSIPFICYVMLYDGHRFPLPPPSLCLCLSLSLSLSLLSFSFSISLLCRSLALSFPTDLLQTPLISCCLLISPKLNLPCYCLTWFPLFRLSGLLRLLMDGRGIPGSPSFPEWQARGIADCSDNGCSGVAITVQTRTLPSRLTIWGLFLQRS